MGKGFWFSQVSFGNEAGMSSFAAHLSEASRRTELCVLEAGAEGAHVPLAWETRLGVCV